MAFLSRAPIEVFRSDTEKKLIEAGWKEIHARNAIHRAITPILLRLPKDAQNPKAKRVLTVTETPGNNEDSYWIIPGDITPPQGTWNDRWVFMLDKESQIAKLIKVERIGDARFVDQLMFVLNKIQRGSKKEIMKLLKISETEPIDPKLAKIIQEMFQEKN